MLGRDMKGEMMSKRALRAPFPYYGGKSRWADEVWREFGEVEIYSEPFFGSGAVLLQAPRISPREIACDRDSMVVNFWRATKNDPEQVAMWADYPSFHDDLTARHLWLIQWSVENRDRVRIDPDFCDSKAAGWWAWGKSLWIGGQWAVHPDDATPGGGYKSDGTPSDLIPEFNGGQPRTGRGTSVHRKTVPTRDGRLERSEDDGLVGDGSRLTPWLFSLAERLQRVFVLNRDWSSAVTESLLMHTKNGKRPPVGVFLDPPYRTDTGRSAGVYGSERQSDDTSEASYLWALEHGEVYRIGYAMHYGDFPVPDGWRSAMKSLPQARKGSVDQIIFSPACVGGGMNGEENA